MSSVRRRKNKSSKKNPNFQSGSNDKRKFFCNRRYRRNLKKRLSNPICDQTSSFVCKSRLISSCSTSSFAMDGEAGTGKWYWENYNNAMEWQSHHFATFWKARCGALEAENKHVYKCLETLAQENAKLLAQVKLHGGEIPATTPQETDTAKMDVVSGISVENYRQVQASGHQQSAVEDSDKDGEEFEFEINEDMLAFLEQSAKHKLELKKQREMEREEEKRAEENEENLKLKFPKESMQQRRDEMARIYGPASSMILSMETAMQLSFDRFNDRYQPKHWPNIPLKL